MKRWYSKFLVCFVPLKLETLEEQQSNDQLAKNVNVEVSFPSEIIEDIVSRLPVKSILRFRSVSKPWLSLISTPSFTQLQLTRATAGHRTALFIIADDVSTCKRYFLSAALGGGSVSHLMTIDLPVCFRVHTEAEHLNGLVSSITMDCIQYSKEALVINPSTRKIFKLPHPTSGVRPKTFRYFFGFDESRNEHKILGICADQSNFTLRNHVMIFSMSNYSWRKIDATNVFSPVRWSHITNSVCVNSKIHLLNLTKMEILAFDLTTEKFSKVKVPLDGEFRVTRRVKVKSDPECPYLIKINGCIGVVSHDRVVETNQMHIWILQDYENRVWVRETITFHDAWIALGWPFPMDSVNSDEVIFSLNKLSRNVIRAPIYNIKSGSFSSVQFTLDHSFLCSETVEFSQIKCYVESMLPLPMNRRRI